MMMNVQLATKVIGRWFVFGLVGLFVMGAGVAEVAEGAEGQLVKMQANSENLLPSSRVFTGYYLPAGEVSRSTQDVAMGDVDGDGDIDVVVANANQTNQLYLNNGSELVLAGDIGTETDDTIDIILADADGDGDLDVWTANGTTSQRNKLYFNNGSGSFSATGTAIGTDNWYTDAIAVGDVDGDGDLDMFMSDNDSDIKLYFNNGSGSFNGTGVQVSPEGNPTLDLAVGDLDGDGDLDLLTGNYAVNKWYRNNGDGTFQATGIPVGSQTNNTRSVAIGDLDGDGDLDIISGDYGNYNRQYFNDGAGNFGQGVVYETWDNYALRAELFDVDGDGDLDAIIGNTGTAGVDVYENDGTGYLAHWQRIQTGSGIQGVGFGDMSGDGLVDIFVGNGGLKNAVYVNQYQTEFELLGPIGSATHPITNVRMGDADGDGDLDLFAGDGDRDKLYFNDGLGTFDPAAVFVGTNNSYTYDFALGDVDGDGDLDVVKVHGSSKRLHFNDGLGNFDATGVVIGNNDGDARTVAMGDVDGDGDLDIVVGHRYGINYLYVNDGTGSFAVGVTVGTEGNNTRDIALVDVDGDLDLDVVAGNYSNPSLVYFNNGSGVFASLGTPIAGLDSGGHHLAFGDLDGDGDLDLVSAGQEIGVPRIFINDSLGGFSLLGVIGLEGGDSSDIALGDVDGDGDLDVVIGGNVNKYTKLVLNDGNGNFNQIIEIDTGTNPTVGVALGDIDEDGDLDLVMGNSGQLNVVYENSGDNFFRLTSYVGSDVDSSQGLASGDMDGDGDLDLAVANDGQLNKVYINDDHGYFNLVNTLGVTSEGSQSIAVGDMDGDGDLDVAVGQAGAVNRLFVNDGQGNFVAGSDFGLATDDSRSVAFGDVDGDGDLDIVVGNDGQTNKLYLNNGLGTFGAGIGVGSETDNSYSVVLADMDGDGDVDMAVGNVGQVNRLYVNDGSGNFGTAVDVGAEIDNSYGVMVGDVDGDRDNDLVVGNAGAANRLYVNDGHGLFRWAADIGSGDDTYSLALGDIDGDGDLDLVTGNVGQTNKVYHNDGNGQFSLFGEVSSAKDPTQSIILVDIDGDGDLDVAAGNSGYVNKLYLNRGNSLFALASHIGLETDNTRSMASGDMDGDGDLDLAIANEGQTNKLYAGVGDHQFDLAGTVDGLNDRSRAVALGDVDGDRDLDLVVSNDGQTNKVYLNDGSGTLSLLGNIGSEIESSYGIALGDLDRDGDLDVVIGDAGRTNKTYLNDGAGGFSLLGNIGLETDSTRSVALGDFDGDRDLDLVVGNDGQTNKIYLNDGTGGLSLWGSIGSETDLTESLVVADVDGDGDLDVVAGNDGQTNKVYVNDGVGNFTLWGTVGSEMDNTFSVAVGDIDGDGDLDVVAGNVGQTNKIYLNDGSGQFSLLTEIGLATDQTYGVLLLDGDRDGDLDVAVANDGQQNQMFTNLRYRHQARVNGRSPIYLTLTQPENLPASNLYSQDGYFTNSIIPISYTLGSQAVDERMEIVPYYSANGGGEWLPAVGTFSGIPSAAQVRNNLVGYWRFDSRPDDDLVDSSANNNNGTLYVSTTVTDHFSIDLPTTYFDNYYAISLNGSSDYIDISPVADNISPNWGFGLWLKAGPIGSGQEAVLGINNQEGNAIFHLVLNANEQLSVYDGGSSAYEITSSMAVADNEWHYVAYSSNGITGSLYVDDQLVGTHGINYSLAPTDNWSLGRIPSLAPTDYLNGLVDEVRVYRRALTGEEIKFFREPKGTFAWDTVATGVANKLDNVVLRLVTQPQVSDNVPGVYQYPYQAMGPILYGANSGSGLPFRLWSNRVQVFSETMTVDNVAADAVVYYMPAGTEIAVPISDAEGQPFKTNGNGYLLGGFEPQIGDRLMALLPITATSSYTLYHTSAPVLANEVMMHTVNAFGNQNLVVSADNPLLMFNLDMSIEWDATNDGLFLDTLATAIRYSSDVLYDISNGQAALGKINLYQNRENWHNADILMYAANDIHPNATMGGIVAEPVNDIGVTGVITNAYRPGLIRMGSNWDPFGENQADLTQDWWQVLTHELGHYLFFLPDNYIGIDDDGLIGTDCIGSFMTTSYDDAYTEFLPEADWVGDCLLTVAEQTTGRPDWETITTFYPMLNAPASRFDYPGPSLVPLAATDVKVIEPTGDIGVQSSRNYTLRDAGTGQIVTIPRARGYLRQTNNTADLTDDSIVSLGSTNAGGDRLKVRGAAVGDEVCVVDTGQVPAYLGCETVGNLSGSIDIYRVGDWQPEIIVSSVSSQTLAITVTQYVSSAQVNVQVIPAYGLPGSDSVITSTWGALTVVDPANPVTFTGELLLDYVVFEGSVRVWVPGTAPVRQAFSEFAVSLDAWGGESAVWGGESAVWSGESAIWGGDSQIWGGESAVWGGPSRPWGAPSVSTDGQFTVLNFDDPYGPTGIGAMQSIASVTSLPPWFSLVGQAYNAQLRPGFERVVTRTVAIDYLQRQVPDGYEYTLTMYHSPDYGKTWLRLPTDLDMEENRAVAFMDGEQPEGIYALIATIEMNPFAAGWNVFGYPINGTRPVTTALASIDGSYTSVYHFNNFGGEWLLYDSLVSKNYSQYAGLVNDLHYLSFGQGYWLYATEPVTLYLGVPSAGAGLVGPSAEGLFTYLPTTYFGPIVPTASFTPTAGMPITAYVDGVVCGNGSVVNWNGGLAYSMQVKGDSGDGCGTYGATVSFALDGQILAGAEHGWDNRQAQYHPLTADVCSAPSVPEVTAGVVGLDVVLSWLDGGADMYEVWWQTAPYVAAGSDCAAAGNCALTADLSYTDVGVVTVGELRVYQVVGQGCGVRSAAAERGVMTVAVFGGQ
ncbi:MAG TPA: FG-GAP-like repeat-containing protein [Anaerolineae bacterium]|nr:FG-GAP-like repeat-containing protein [Anaerolineae bacterium]